MNIKKYLPLFITVLYFAIQLLFLKSDPDIYADPFSRGAWTDEGLYTSQIRNFIDNGIFNIEENVTFIRGPLFNIIQLPFFYIFGTSLWLSRLIVITLTSIVLFVFFNNKKLNNLGCFMFFFAFLEFHIFQFSHFGMAEMICIDFILLSLYFFFLSEQCTENRYKKKMLLFSALFLFLCYSVKINYIYCVFILPLAILVISLSKSFLKRKFEKKDYVALSYSIIFTIVFAGVYFLIWYLPNREFISLHTNRQMQGIYSTSIKLIIIDTWYIFLRQFWVNIFKTHIIHLIIILFFAFIFYALKRKKSVNQSVLIYSLMWLLLEIHKLPMHYLPYRYILSLIFASCVFISAVYSQGTVTFPKLKIILMIIAIIFGLQNMKYNYDAYCRRTYQLEIMNNYLSKYEFKHKPVIGTWAASLCWKCKAVTYPVMNDFTNKELIKQYKPALVVSEIDENDSNQAYKKRGINLMQIADSCRIFKAWNYKLALYWIKPEH